MLQKCQNPVQSDWKESCISCISSNIAKTEIKAFIFFDISSADVPASIKKVLNALANNQEIVITDKNEELTPIVISKNIKITQSSRNDNILILNAKEYDTPEPNPYLVNAIVKSFYYHKQIQAGKTIEDLQTEECLKDSKYIHNILNLKYISPQLTEQILNGTQSENLSLQRLINNI